MYEREYPLFEADGESAVHDLIDVVAEWYVFLWVAGDSKDTAMQHEYREMLRDVPRDIKRRAQHRAKQIDWRIKHEAS